ncbi:class I adenylate-forming enzyme family protein [Paraliomyxa miuraensis]|uniref:class I adenylate-forming enzyme family protein n=1 Tax=Paraliomyxa miuraensis TaxID=376150 RepID=UPI0022564029|nr:AMP-binding protein [Paraliomyxa miuraensis]MCX4239690.1 AMP-binding protein [Paraliomyxa miuraensis]
MLRERLAGLGLSTLAQRVAADPPHRIMARALRVTRQTHALRAGGDLLALAAVAVRRGLDVRSMHALHAAAAPGRTALVDAHRRLDYATLDAEIDAIALALHEDGARRGEPVGMLMENRCEYVATWMGLTRLGIACAHMGTSSTPDELEPLLQRSRIRRLFVSDATWPTADAVARAHPELGLRLFHVGSPQAPAPHGASSYHALVRTCLGRPLPSPRGRSESASVVYTSGTTGRPKGAVRDLAALGAMELLRILERLPLRMGDRHLVVAPLYHSGAQAFVLINTALGATVTLMDHFDAARALDLLSQERIHSTFMVPTMIRRILDLPPEHHAHRPTPALRAIVSGAAPFGAALRQRAIARFGARTIFDFYGATELGWVTLASGEDMLERPGTLGQPLAGQELRVVDEQGRTLPSGEVGKIYTRSGQHMRGYLEDGARGVERAPGELTEPGWITVDDLGYLDEDGHLFLTGRARDMVITGGVNVYPVEVESVLSQHPRILDVAVLGVPDEEWGERLLAVVVPGEGFDPDEATAWARARLARAKVPRRWETIDVLPRNPTGKILKGTLRDRFGAAAGSTVP